MTDGRAPAQRRDFREGNGLWWLLGGVVAVATVTVVVAAAALVLLLREIGGTAAPAPTTTPAPAPAGEGRALARGTTTPAPPAPGRPAELPPVRASADLPPQDAEALGTAVEVTVSPLRYRVIEVFGTTSYNCLFSVGVRNLTAEPQEVRMGFRATGAPTAVWEGDRPTALDPGERRELVLGWDGATPEEVELDEARCTGPVELTALGVAPG